MNPRAVPGSVADHYRRPGLLAAIEDAIAAAGKSIRTVTADDLAPLDEFHIGGRGATAEVLQWLAGGTGQHLVDIGCGLGGPARFVAASRQCRVTGVDLTEDYISAGNTISRWLGQDGDVSLVRADALDLPFRADAFDGGYLIHAGMNVRDKARLFVEAARVLRRGARVVVYDVMRMAPGDLDYPLPWATSPAHCALSTPDDYRLALTAAGFAWSAEHDRRPAALEYFARQRAVVQEGGPMRPIGLHLLMGARRREQVSHMSDAIDRGVITPMLMIAERQ
jgi:SAM-dependent methyltransferase